MSVVPYKLSGLTTREEITDAMLRLLIGIDSNDVAIFDSAWATPNDAVEYIIFGNKTTGLDQIKSSMLAKVGPLTTQHTLSNVRIDVEEAAGTATATANGINQHFTAGKGLEPGATPFLAGVSYFFDFVKEASGEWKIRSWEVKVIWGQGDMSLVA